MCHRRTSAEQSHQDIHAAPWPAEPPSADNDSSRGGCFDRQWRCRRLATSLERKHTIYSPAPLFLCGTSSALKDARDRKP